jgi:proton-dependent oligopeptide transporter, POT family
MIIANNPLQVKSIQQWQESRLKEMELSSTSTSSSLSTSSSSSFFIKILPGPNHLWAIIAQEAGERFCYYGLRSVMTLFLVDVFLYSNAKATSLISFWISATYLSPILGGFLADAIFGRFKTITIFSFIYLFGTIALAIAANITLVRDGAFFLGLALVALGTGGVKANVVSFGVDQLVGAGCSDADVTSYFAMFYATINVGSLFSYLIMPVARAKAGFGIAFCLPLSLLIFATVVFLSASRYYTHVKPTKSVLSSVWTVCYNASYFKSTRQSEEREPLTSSLPKNGSISNSNSNSLQIKTDSTISILTGTFLDKARGKVDDEDIIAVAAILRLLPIIALLPIFWALYDSSSVTWTLQARRLNLHGIEPDQTQVLNPLNIILMVPLWDRILRYMHKLPQQWLHPTPLRRMVAGSFLTSLAFAMSGLLESAIRPDYKPSVFWQLPQLLTLSVAELCLSTTGLEFFFREAPPSMKGVILSAFYLTTSIGDFLNGILYAAIDGVLTETQIIWLLSSMMLFISFIFLYVNYSFKPKSSDEFTNSIDMSEMSKGKEKNNNSTSKGKEKSILDDKEQIGA